MLKSYSAFGDMGVPVLALAIHNGHEMPAELLHICGIKDTDRLREEDPHTCRIAQNFANHICLLSSRFMVDLNRRPDMAVYQKPEDCWGLYARTEPIPSAYLQALYAAYQSWYAMLDYQIEKLLAIHKSIVVLDLHSYNHRRGGPFAEPDPQLQNPDIIIGRSTMDSSYYPVVHKLTQALNGLAIKGETLDCREDVKFPGGYLSRYLHAKYPHKVLSLSIEFKKIFMDEHSSIVDEEFFGELIAYFTDKVKIWLKDPDLWKR